MNRRHFIRRAATLGFTPVFLNSSVLKAHNSMYLLNNFSCSDIQERSLVFINLLGGNDGINTVIPMDEAKYDIYLQNRPNIAIPRTGTTGAINLDSTIPQSGRIGLHPSMSALKSLYDDGKLNVLNGVGYQNNNRSHFKAQNHWLTGGDSSTELNDLQSGWIGRYFGSIFPSNIDEPTTAFPDPLGLELGAVSSSLLFKTNEGKTSNIILTVDASKYYSHVAGLGTTLPDSYNASHFKDEIDYIHGIEKSTNLFSARISNVFNNGNNAVSYPDTSLSNQLKTVARLIKGGSKTKVFLVHQGTYDTHINQVERGSSNLGTHAGLLKELAEAIKAFQQDLEAMGLEDKVITSTYSEFGRTVDQNANWGTDHGGVNPMFVIGKGVKPGISGTPIDLTKVEDRGCTDLQFDYRSIYASLLQDFLAVDDAVLSASLPTGFINNKASILKTDYISPSSCYQSFSVLPVQLLDLSASTVNNEAIRVNWSTAQEINTKDFVLERSSDGAGFTPITRIAAAGNSNTQKNYEWLDHDAKDGINYYRLLQSDLDGKYQYFGPVRAVLQKTKITNVKSYPNPSVNQFTVSVSSTSRQKADIVIMDIEGHPLHKTSAQLKTGLNTFQYNNSQFRGTKQLLIAVRLENGTLETLRQLMQ